MFCCKINWPCLFVLQLKGQGSDLWYWASITQGESCSSRNANDKRAQCNVVQCIAGAMHCQMLVAKICNGGKRPGGGAGGGGGGAGTLEFILLSQSIDYMKTGHKKLYLGNGPKLLAAKIRRQKKKTVCSNSGNSV